MSESPLLSVSELVKQFPTRQGAVQAVSDVSFTIGYGETVGLVGESGCGKSTLGKTLIRLLDPDAGAIRLEGVDIARMSRRELRPYRPVMQMIFQDPYASLNPRNTVGRSIGESLDLHGHGTPAERRERVEWLADKVGLPRDALRRYPHEFSGGQRQRIGIARALALNPKLIICDEPVSALDLSIQAQVLNLLVDIQQEFGLSYLFISHDLSVVEYISDRIIVMYLGKIVEVAGRSSLWARPLHPYTQALIGALPPADPDAARTKPRVAIQGDAPNPAAPPPGCRFHTRCAYATDECRMSEPPLRPLAGGERLVACHRVKEAAGGGIATPMD